MNLISFESIISADALASILDFFRRSRRYEKFLINTSSVITKSENFIDTVKSQANFNGEMKNQLFKDWTDIYSSDWNSLPSQSKDKLKQLSYVIARDIGKLRFTDLADDGINELSDHLKEVSRIVEKLIHPKFASSLKLAIKSTRRLLSVFPDQHTNSFPDMRQAYLDLERDCNHCRWLSKYTEPSISDHCKTIQDLIRDLSEHMKAADALPPLNNITRLEKEAGADQTLLDLKKQILKELNQISPGSRTPGSGCLVVASSCIVSIILLLGVKDYTSEAISTDIKSSDGDHLLIKDIIGVTELVGKCSANKKYKENALKLFAQAKTADQEEKMPALRKAQENMLFYSQACPVDSEAQIYLNNYAAHISLGRPELKAIPVVTLAAVVPISRTMGVKDSVEVLRGIALGQYASNVKAANQPLSPAASNNKDTKQPLYPFILIKIFDDGLQSSSEDETRARSKEIARSIVKTEENSAIAGVIGHFSSGSTEATSKIYNLYNMPVISPTSTNVRMDLDSCRYKLPGVAMLNWLLAPASNGFAKNFLANYGFFLGSIGDSFVNKICEPAENVLDLDPNIFRMAPDDKVAQSNLFDYLSTYNASALKNNLLSVNRIVLISEDRDSSTYSKNFRGVLQQTIKERKLESQYNFVADHCRFNPASNTFQSKDKCRESILENPEGITALLVVPSSKAIKFVQFFIGNILRDAVDREKLIVLGADSLMTSELSDPVYKGVVITAASMEAKYPFPLASKNQSKLSFNWRAQMSYDSLIVFREALAKAYSRRGKSIAGRELQRSLLANMSAKLREASFNHENIEIQRQNNDRDTSNTSALNVLLCLDRPGSTDAFKQLDIKQLPNLPIQVMENSLCMP
ncbi:MAG: ABC transporter substrate-binding protein [Cyanobacteriota bacterium]|nr:ABC transporter substrate-binding protein [Cyanobacteriota bacterium]